MIYQPYIIFYDDYFIHIQCLRRIRITLFSVSRINAMIMPHYIVLASKQGMISYFHTIDSLNAHSSPAIKILPDLNL